MFEVAPSFRGMKMLPPGMHLFHYRSGPTCKAVGVFVFFAAGQVKVRDIRYHNGQLLVMKKIDSYAVCICVGIVYSYSILCVRILYVVCRCGVGTVKTSFLFRLVLTRLRWVYGQPYSNRLNCLLEGCADFVRYWHQFVFFNTQSNLF